MTAVLDKPQLPICRRCADQRENAGFAPRELVRLPLEVVDDEIFNKRTEPVILCEFCDDQTLRLAMRAHGLRAGKYTDPES